MFFPAISTADPKSPPCRRASKSLAGDMAEALAISLSAKLAVALSRGAAIGLSSLLGVRSEIAAAARDLDLFRAFLRSTDSRHGTETNALAAAWVTQVRDAAFELEDVADECCYLSGHGRDRSWVNVRARRRYLVVLDDVWDAHLWDKLHHAFVDERARSRVVITYHPQRRRERDQGRGI
ncbi:hypothetical protein BAE44_0014919 [Dichanthelium oligosanthes]|uniref:Disease resistance N-terminal domain-containing protein n=1 Tax=Dichanthelium oligosanthes TaxID=888268 RepID=A0A1E5VG12_9POAL|nr:hypothetical protein BAE44_0014919 [Dichanthelium oligosanthes]